MKRIVLKGIGWAVVMAALAFVGLVIVANYSDWDMPNRARLYAVKTDISQIQASLRLFHNANSRYPDDLSELTEGSERSSLTKSWLIELPRDPWGHPYRYRLEPSGDRYKIWTTPDSEYQRHTELTELSNNTDWQKVLK
ncbi:MAG TPA: type II secretion system protein GspG [Nevskia sp.]|nr:type II secretion system protein GspG [Nevskia sp.]